MSTFLPLVGALIVLSISSLPSTAVAGDCQASCQLTLARCIQNVGDSCFKTWRSCVVDKGCEGAYGLARREHGTSDTSAPQASPPERPRGSAPPTAGGPPPRQPNKVPLSAPPF